jgi:hypothetical protein
MKRSRCLLLLFAALFFVTAGGVTFGVLLDRTLRPPDEWFHAVYGMPRSEVHKLCPNAYTELVTPKGDFWHAMRPLGWWRMQISYDEQQRVQSKIVSLHIGTQHTFRRYPIL